MTQNLTILEKNLLESVTGLIEQTQIKTISQVNSNLVLLFWKIGERINESILQDKRAEYGKKIISNLSQKISLKYGRNFEEKNLRRMIQFYIIFNDFENVVTLSRHLSWSHFLVLIPLKSTEMRSYYSRKAFDELLSVRELRKNIGLKSFERAEIANSQLPNTVLNNQYILKDPYFLHFLNLENGYLENDLERAILKDLEVFILEIGKGFTFIERQKRMIIDGEDHYLDLLFYHRTLKRLVAIELKINKFEAKYKGQMELYLKWLNKYERKEWEEEPIGLILCAESRKETVELLEMGKNGIMVAEYWTDLPPKEILEAKLHRLLCDAKERVERIKLDD